MADRRPEPRTLSKLLQTETAQAASTPLSLPDDPVAEALKLIQADMTAQARSGADDADKRAKEPVVIKLNKTAYFPPSPPAATRAAPRAAPSASEGRGTYRQRSWSPPRRRRAEKSVFQDDIENFCLQVRRGGHGGSVTKRFGELLQRQTVVQQLQRRLHAQTAEMRAEAASKEEAADRERRQRFANGQPPPPESPPPYPPTTAAETLMVLRDQGGCCGAADLCLTPHDFPRALALIHRLRCEVLDLRACALRATCDKNEVVQVLNHERAQLRRTFTSAQMDRLTGKKAKVRWDDEDVRRAIAARRILTRRQYRYLTESMGVPLPPLKLRNKAFSTGGETKRLYEQLVEEKVLTHMTKKRRTNVKRPGRPAATSVLPMPTEDPEGLITMAPASSESEEEAFELQ